ncbi:MAG: ribonuclease III [Oscillospiraceae bacterium]|nr:ribonuclease III [Oscillospiraceae bacterium]
MNNNENINLKNPSTLAFLGDAVYSLMVREYIIKNSDAPVGTLHKRAANMVSAGAQAGNAAKIAEILTDEEKAVLKRGRNAHTNHTPKNCTERDYHMATAFEALLGYLYLKGETNRICELFQYIL